MNYPKYELATSTQSDIYEFTSTGTKGSIPKLIEYTSTDTENVYNLGFGDKIETEDENGKIIYTFIDNVKSDNGDRNTILATVAETVYTYTEIYPNRSVIFTGSDEVRTRLYRMAISKNYDELSQDFHIFGIITVNNQYIEVPFNKGESYEAFIVYRKIKEENENNK